MATSWVCPFCGQMATKKAIESSYETHTFDKTNKYGAVQLRSDFIACPNEECQEITLSIRLSKVVMGSVGYRVTGVMDSWNILPSASVKVFPDYVPKAIIDNYVEAAKIRTLSPKASATLSRRCLQGMIRHFWGVKSGRLVDEITAIKEKVSHDTWEAIDAVRSIGNIGAHMEKDIDLIVDVEPEEAELLIQLIETLINDWYVEREERKKRTSRIIDLAAEKQAARKPS
ncbi:TPA: DUF4145 domain-containing protein [Yersinia enterocolitica]|uniref:DUF4145 domain-containing protein n=1 Tax=Yersinia TaxID=629 RepID=UPI001D11084E|nr:DUF4145 domain-containing protein [Yersinia proxima]EKN4012740.1 DUF4145 domain-containing protein [Yersinia enterocolitica]ELI8046927.1 DUF4145 domain-containing protein [Yersinia enterocolitica]ELI8444717.1 DUF4145 domain-containing protein [Yersinia enterocolitica]HDL6897257.1 DUF4145 domain-containing protein [Yersinia enterocolitica]HDM8322721.1 DUF4145 domain-containing protein [Yersinia enterocolitica]